MVFLFLVSLRCGQQSSENCTYFQSSGTEQGACNAKICAKPGVCQLRLDFPKFAIGMKCLWNYHQFTIYLIYKYLWAKKPASTGSNLPDDLFYTFYTGQPSVSTVSAFNTLQGTILRKFQRKYS